MKKILIFYYFGGAGGKFIANCLSFSGQVAFSNYQVSKKFLADQDLVFLEQQLLATVPEKQNHRAWLDLEQGCQQLFGHGIKNLKNGQELIYLNNLSEFEQVWLPLMTNTPKSFNSCRSYFEKQSQVFTVLVDSDPEFIDYAIRKKWKNPEHCLDLHAYKEFKSNLDQMRFDFVFENWDPRVAENHQQIQLLAKNIGCEFDWNLAKKYVDKYVDFHQD